MSAAGPALAEAAGADDAVDAVGRRAGRRDADVVRSCRRARAPRPRRRASVGCSRGPGRPETVSPLVNRRAPREIPALNSTRSRSERRAGFDRRRWCEARHLDARVPLAVDDLNVESVESLLVSIGAPRVRRLGLRRSTTVRSPEQRLYRLLASGAR